MIHGGSSGIGYTAIQIAKQFGAIVFTTVGNEEKAKFCRDLGADHVINYRTDDFVAEVKRITGERGVDIVLDMVGGPYIEKNVSLLTIRREAGADSFSSRKQDFQFQLSARDGAAAYDNRIDLASSHRRREGEHRKRVT